jgi:hypothetical protein
MSDGIQRFGEALGRLEEELDWQALGRLYCYEGGEDFFPPEQVEAQREAGLQVAAALGERLRPGGRSLYVGAALAELVAILCEALVLEREVVAVNLRGPEALELNRALAAVEKRCGFALPRIGFRRLETIAGRFDHGWLVSVVNDPEAFPALHDHLYGRTGALAVGGGDLARERKRATRLVDAWLERLEDGALLATTDEELPLIQPRIAAADGVLELEELAILSAIVGDPIRFGTLRSSRAQD